MLNVQFFRTKERPMLSREKSRPNFARQKCSRFSAQSKGLTMLAAGLCGLLPAIAQAATVTTAEVRGDIVYVAGEDAGRKQAILWEGVQVTSSNPKGRFSFEGDLPAGCVPGDCTGTLTAGGDTITVTVDYEDNEPPGEPPGEELQLISQRPAAHDGDDVRAVGIALAGASEQIVSGGEDAQLRYWTPELSQRSSNLGGTERNGDLRPCRFRHGLRGGDGWSPPNSNSAGTVDGNQGGAIGRESQLAYEFAWPGEVEDFLSGDQIP